MNFETCKMHIVGAYIANHSDFTKRGEALVNRKFGDKLIPIATELFMEERIRGIYFTMAVVLRYNSDKHFVNEVNQVNIDLNINDYIDAINETISDACRNCHDKIISGKPNSSCLLLNMLSEFSSDNEFIYLAHEIQLNDQKYSTFRNGKEAVILTAILTNYICENVLFS